MAGARELAGGVAKVALAGLIGGPFAAAQEAGSQIIDTVVARDPQSRD